MLARSIVKEAGADHTPPEAISRQPTSRLRETTRTTDAANRPAVPDYELLRRVGTGAYGEIWLAQSTATGVLRAVKIVWRHNFEEERPFQREFEGIQRFERISREHPSQLALFHIGRNDAAGYFYYVMELADDVNVECSVRSAELNSTAHSALRAPQAYRPHTLRADLDQGRLAAARVLEIGMALSEALGHLHSHGLVHRDVKPSNVIFVNGRPKLADIGLVTDVGDERSIVGTEGYLPPEGPGTPQADIFALGKVLYEAATGLDRRQFPQLPSELRAWPDGALVLELNDILIKAAETNPRLRYQSAGRVQADLELLSSGQSIRHLRTVEEQLAILKKAGIVACVCALLGLGILYETNQRRNIAKASLVRSHVDKGTRLLNEGDLFGSLLSFTEALRLDQGNAQREECHRIRIASVLRECPKLVGLFAHSNAPINDASFSPDSRSLVTSGDDNTARVWDLATARLLFSLGHWGQVYSGCFSPDGRVIATTSSDDLVHLWDATNGAVLRPASIRHRARYAGLRPLFRPKGDRLLTLYDPGSVSLWDPRTGTAIANPLRHQREVTSFSFSPDGRYILTLGLDKVARVWDALTGEGIAQFDDGVGVTSGAFSPDGGVLATGTEDNYVRLRNLPSGELLLPPIMLRQAADAVEFDPEGMRLATTCRDRTVELWDLGKRTTLIRPLLHELKVFRADFSPDGRWLATSSHGNRVRLWDTDSGQMLPPPFLHNTPRGPAIFSPDGHLLLTVRSDLNPAPNQIVVVWSLAKVESPHLEIRPPTTYQQVLTSPNGNFKAILSGDTVYALAGGTGKPMTEPLKHTAPVRQASFSPDASVLLTEDIGARAQVWDLSTGEPLTSRLKIRYALAARPPERAFLPHDLRRDKDLMLLAEVLSGNRVDEAGGFHPIDSGTLVSTWNQLRRKPEFRETLADSAAEVLAWHYQEARACEQAWNWTSALFHLEFLLKNRPDDRLLKRRRDYAKMALAWANGKASGWLERRAVNPPRDLAANERMIDLSPYYTLVNRSSEESLATFPSGLQVFGGTAFDVRGVVQLSGQIDPPSSTAFPKQVPGIPVKQRCRRLHFLHSTASKASKDGDEVGRYVIHYTNGRTNVVPIVYGRDVRSRLSNLAESLTSERAALVWVGANPQQFDEPRSLRLYKSTWENPWPEAELATMDFISGPRAGGPFLVALTAE
jgi:WD40 repeat protein